MSSRSSSYHYSECGLSHVYLGNGFDIERFDDEEFVSIANINGLQQAIATVLCQKVSSLTPSEIRFIRKELNYSTQQLSVIMRADIEKIESGDKPIFQALDHQLRILYLVLTKQSTSIIRSPFQDATQARLVFKKDDDCNWSLQH